MHFSLLSLVECEGHSTLRLLRIGAAAMESQRIQETQDVRGWVLRRSTVGTNLFKITRNFANRQPRAGLEMIIRTATLGCAIIAWFGIMVSLLIMGYAAFRAGFNLAEERPRRWLVDMNRFNAIWFSDQLSQKGMHYRALRIRAFRLFLGSALGFVIFGFLAAMSAAFAPG